jgi:hypothetical protein
MTRNVNHNETSRKDRRTIFLPKVMQIIASSDADGGRGASGIVRAVDTTDNSQSINERNERGRRTRSSQAVCCGHQGKVRVPRVSLYVPGCLEVDLTGGSGLDTKDQIEL